MRLSDLNMQKSSDSPTPISLEEKSSILHDKLYEVMTHVFLSISKRLLYKRGITSNVRPTVLVDSFSFTEKR